jgi:hypothetical protein
MNNATKELSMDELVGSNPELKAKMDEAVSTANRKSAIVSAQASIMLSMQMARNEEGGFDGEQMDFNVGMHTGFALGVLAVARGMGVVTVEDVSSLIPLNDMRERIETTATDFEVARAAYMRSAEDGSDPKHEILRYHIGKLARMG